MQKEYYNYDTVAEYRESIKNEIQDTIDEKVTEAKKQAVLTKLQERMYNQRLSGGLSCNKDK